MSTVLLDIRGAIGTITLNRPQALNALDADMAAAWASTARRAAGDERIKAIIVRGEGPAFCAGGDIKAMHAIAGRGEAITILAREINTGLRALVESAKPVVAAAHGTTAGGGLGVLLSTDYAILGESSRVGSLYASVGLTPDLSVTAHLARAVGERRALQLTLSQRLLSAAQALEWGLAAEVVPDDAVASRAQEVAEGWVEVAHAYGQAKRLIRSAAHRPLAEQLEDEARTIGAASATPEARARMGAFSARG